MEEEIPNTMLSAAFIGYRPKSFGCWDRKNKDYNNLMKEILAEQLETLIISGVRKIHIGMARISL